MIKKVFNPTGFPGFPIMPIDIIGACAFRCHCAGNGSDYLIGYATGMYEQIWS